MITAPPTSSIAREKARRLAPGLLHHHRHFRRTHSPRGPCFPLHIGRDSPPIVIMIVAIAVSVAIPVISVPMAVAVVPSGLRRVVRRGVVAVAVIVVAVVRAIAIPIAVASAVVAVVITVAAAMVVPVGLPEQPALARIECGRFNPCSGTGADLARLRRGGRSQDSRAHRQE